MQSTPLMRMPGTRAEEPARPERAPWIATSMSFRFQLGEWTFARRRLPVALLDRHFTELDEDPEAITLPRGRFDGITCYAVMSQPIPMRLPPVSWYQETLRLAIHQYEHSVVMIEGRFDDYLKNKFPRDRKKKLIYKVRKYCEEAGREAPFRSYRGAAEFREFYRVACAISENTYQTQVLGKGMASESVDEWAALAEKDDARGWILFCKEKPVAFIAGRARGEVFNDEYIGYDPAYAQWGPGNILQYYVLEQIFAEGRFRIWDFGEGAGGHKTRFSNRDVLCADLYFFPLRPTPLALFGSQAGLFFASRGVVHTLDRFGLKNRIKRLIRGQGAAAGADEAKGGGESA